GAFPAKVRSDFAQDNASDKEHFQQKCEAILRRTMHQTKSISSKSVKRFCAGQWVGQRAFPAKVRSGFAQDNASDKQDNASDKEHFQQKCEAVLRRTMH